jgi:hypothetical protein
LQARIEIYRLQQGRFRWNWAWRNEDGQVKKQGMGFEFRPQAIASAKSFNGSKEIYLANGDAYEVGKGKYPIVLIRSSGQDVGEIYSPSSSNGSTLSVKIDAANSSNAARG